MLEIRVSVAATNCSLWHMWHVQYGRKCYQNFVFLWQQWENPSWLATIACGYIPHDAGNVFQSCTISRSVANKNSDVWWVCVFVLMIKWLV